MRWYFNDASLQGQFAPSSIASSEANREDFEFVLRELIAARPHIHPLHVTRSLPSRFVSPGTTVRSALQQSRNRDLRRAVLLWLDRAGPFTEDDRLLESDDLFMFSGLDITDSGLGEAARRIRALEAARTFSLPGGAVNFAHSPLVAIHGLPEEPLGEVHVKNVWSISQLRVSAANEVEICGWRDLIAVAQRRYSHLLIPDAVFLNKLLAREPFSDVIARQALTLLGHLEAYMADRGPDGEEGAVSREVYENFFVGATALFSSESVSNKEEFKAALTFPKHDGEGEIFAHWHGKIRHRFFRLHFEFPVPKGESKIRVVYLGPKLTKG